VSSWVSESAKHPGAWRGTTVRATAMSGSRWDSRAPNFPATTPFTLGKRPPNRSSQNRNGGILSRPPGRKTLALARVGAAIRKPSNGEVHLRFLFRTPFCRRILRLCIESTIYNSLTCYSPTLVPGVAWGDLRTRPQWYLPSSWTGLANHGRRNSVAGASYATSASANDRKQLVDAQPRRNTGSAYEVLQILAGSGMGAVYKARDAK